MTAKKILPKTRGRVPERAPAVTARSPKHQKRCGHCGTLGHRKTTCPLPPREREGDRVAHLPRRT